MAIAQDSIFRPDLWIIRYGSLLMSVLPDQPVLVGGIVTVVPLRVDRMTVRTTRTDKNFSVMANCKLTWIDQIIRLVDNSKRGQSLSRLIVNVSGSSPSLKRLMTTI
ncbi:hypothetical protein J6590_076097 [Homalodisca vitripennis]|nr:hypothetical protein J6590_076097 [Homalodisca vitripennis]